jgi:hypothetical protein
MEWEVFADGLTTALAGLRSGALVVITEIGEPKRCRYVQLAQSPSELCAYLVVNSFLAEDVRASADGERIIAELGWRPPAPAEGHDNWWYVLPWPATSQGYATVARMAVSGLRVGYGIPGPSSLRYRAWDENTGEDLGLPGLGLPVEARS